jgi:hypothetical protein
MTYIKLYVTDHGDPSVGIFPETWEIQTPFSTYQPIEKQILEEFRKGILELYSDYTDCIPVATYEFEIEEPTIIAFDLPEDSNYLDFQKSNKTEV